MKKSTKKFHISKSKPLMDRTGNWSTIDPTARKIDNIKNNNNSINKVRNVAHSLLTDPIDMVL